MTTKGKTWQWGKQKRTHCKRCGEKLTLENAWTYQSGKVETHRYFHTYCKKCNRILFEQHKAAHPRKVARTQLRANLKKSYGVTLEWYEETFEAQGHCCAICGRRNLEEPKSRNLDHCHVTGRNRGILCTPCNTAIAVVEAVPGWFAKAHAYLVQHGTDPSHLVVPVDSRDAGTTPSSS